jgi:hypothetical protein
MPSTYEPIATQTLGSPTVTITFSSIPSTYTDLRVVIVYSPESGSAPILRFNNDSSTNYSNTMLIGDGSAVSSNSNTSTTEIFTGYTAASNQLAFSSYDIFSYAGSTNKTVLYDNSLDNNGSGYVIKAVGLWRSTSAINRIDLIGRATVNLKAGTTATLYGIKNV